MKPTPTYIVDTFTDKAFKGNPAGVCLLDSEMEVTQMLSIAQELNLSETAFVVSTGTGFSIRYFSPVMEIPLCGHATLASAKVLYDRGHEGDILFTTHSKLELKIQQSGEAIMMQFPIYQTEKAEAPKPLLDALGINEIVNCEYNRETNILIVEIGSTAELAALDPDFATLVTTHDSIHGVSVTAASSADTYDFHSRYFWPWSGSNEDPVTGATHTFLANYWSKRLNKKKMKSFQASKRSGFMQLELVDDATLLIMGQAVIVFEGNLRN